MKRIILLLLVCLTVLAQSCSSDNVLSEGDTHSEVDTYSDPHSSPEAVVQAFVEAVIAGDCDQAVSYARPIMLWLPHEMCVGKYYVSANIDDVIVKENTIYNRQKVTEEDLKCKYYQNLTDRLIIYAEQIEGKWYACP